MSNFITNAFSSLFSHLTGLGSDAWHYIQNNVIPYLKSDATNTLTALAPIAESAVLQLATTGHVSNDKRDIAEAQVKQAAIAAGLDVSTSLLRLAVETAYSKLNANGQIQPSNAAPATVNPSVPTTPAATN